MTAPEQQSIELYRSTQDVSSSLLSHENSAALCTGAGTRLRPVFVNTSATSLTAELRSAIMLKHVFGLEYQGRGMLPTLNDTCRIFTATGGQGPKECCEFLRRCRRTWAPIVGRTSIGQGQHHRKTRQCVVVVPSSTEPGQQLAIQRPTAGGQESVMEPEPCRVDHDVSKASSSSACGQRMHLIQRTLGDVLAKHAKRAVAQTAAVAKRSSRGPYRSRTRDRPTSTELKKSSAHDLNRKAQRLQHPLKEADPCSAASHR